MSRPDAHESTPAPARTVLLNVSTALQDVVIVFHLALAMALLLVHLIFPTKLFFAFTALYEWVGRGYWTLITASEARADSWIVPPLLSALAGDVLWLLAVVLPAMLPFLIVRHLALKQQSLAGMVGDFVLGELWALIKALSLGALFGALAVAMAMVMLYLFGSPISSKPGVVVDPFTSGIVMVDLLLISFALWSERKRTTEYNLVGRVVLAALLAVVLLIVSQLVLKLEVSFEVAARSRQLAVYGFDSSNVNDALTRKSEWDGAAHRFGFASRGTPRFAAKTLTAKSRKRWLRLFVAQPQRPFLAGPESLYSKRPAGATLDGRVVRVRYRLSPWTTRQRQASHPLSFIVDRATRAGEQRHVVPRSRPSVAEGKRKAMALRVVLMGAPLKIGQRWGISADFTPRDGKAEPRRVRVMADGQRVYLESEDPAGKRFNLLQAELKTSVKELTIKDEEPTRGLSIFANGQPLFHLQGKRRSSYNAVLQRPGGLQRGDRATLRAELITATER
jgi:hypothetical protein